MKSEALRNLRYLLTVRYLRSCQTIQTIKSPIFTEVKHYRYGHGICWKWESLAHHVLLIYLCLIITIYIRRGQQSLWITFQLIFNVQTESWGEEKHKAGKPRNVLNRLYFKSFLHTSLQSGLKFKFLITFFIRVLSI